MRLATASVEELNAELEKLSIQSRELYTLKNQLYQALDVTPTEGLPSRGMTIFDKKVKEIWKGRSDIEEELEIRIIYKMIKASKYPNLAVPPKAHPYPSEK